MCTPITNLFFEVCSKVNNKLYFQQLMIKQQLIFDIQPYKIDKLYSDSAKKLFKQICFKYQNSKELLPDENVWHQNQRKIFIWFVVCYFHQLGIQDPSETEVSWNLISSIFFNKNPSFLKFQFLNIIKLKKRIIWTSEEDSLLIKATDEEGVGKWNQISKCLFFNSNGTIFKTPKHCRERWLNHLDQNKNKGKWTDQQDYTIFNFVKQTGKKWSKIVQTLNNTRTEHMVKNRYNSLLTKNRKNKKQKQTQAVNKIVRSLEKMLKIDSQIKLVEDDYAVGNEHQLQMQQQSFKNPKIQKNQIQVKQEKKVQSQVNKQWYEISNFETMPFLSNSVHNNLFEIHLSTSECLNNLNSESILYCPSQISSQKSCKLQSSIMYLNRKKEDSFQCSKQQIIYKTKPVYIIQHNI